MISGILFGSGIVFTLVITVTMPMPGDSKRDLIVLPFMLFAGAAVGHYLGF